ncbi:MAG: hypothetical protein Q9166_003003 [cf. Caloplaca sp. 2 TL-2023]
MSMLLNKQDDYVTRWARKIFTRQEWPNLWQRFHRANAPGMSSETPDPQILLPNLSIMQREEQVAELRQGHTRTAQNEDTMQSSLLVHEPPLPSLSISEHRWRLLAQYLAGRWAVKEAAVKASPYRKLLLRDISIVPSNSHGKVHALVDPERTTEIVMDPKVAEIRGLPEARSPDHGIYGQVMNSKFVRSSNTLFPNRLGSRFLIRRAKIEDELRQVAEISISHDEDYAVAVCMAVAGYTENNNVEYIIDNGSGAPLHEPEWGDRGFLHGE